MRGATAKPPAVHLIWLYRRRADIAGDAFERYWRDTHATLVRQLTQVRRYVQDIVLPGEGPAAAWDGVAELWVDDDAAADQLLAGRDWAAALRADERRFVDVAAVLRLRTVDRTIVAGPPTVTDEVFPKRMTFFRRKPGLSRDEAWRYWREVHAPLAASVPGLCRYVQSTVQQSTGSPLGPGFDGVAQLWFDDAAALQAIVASAMFREVVKPDERNFIAVEESFTLAVVERRVV